jgi:hypothetical protein
VRLAAVDFSSRGSLFVDDIMHDGEIEPIHFEQRLNQRAWDVRVSHTWTARNVDMKSVRFSVRMIAMGLPHYGEDQRITVQGQRFPNYGCGPR